MEEVRNYESIVYIKNIFEMAGIGGCIPLILPPGHKLLKPLKGCGVF